MAANDSSVEESIDETFHRILDILAQLGVYKKSPKFFLIYAHDNEKLREYEAHSALVKKFIEWFKKLRLDVDSDRSPHGLVPGRGVEIEGASVDIIKNQVCLLPQQLQERSVSYVIIFGSQLLEKYMEDEATLMLLDGKSYITALSDACRDCAKSRPRKPTDSIDTNIIESVVKEIYRIQLRYSKMTDFFHHVLTEMALVDFREEFGSSSYTLPVRLGKLRDDDTSFPKSISSKKTRLRVSVDPDSAYTSLFKILLEFEDFEEDRALLEALRDAFADCVRLLSDGNRRSPDQSRNEREAVILHALRKLNDSERYRERERQITTPSIRRILNKQSLFGLSSIRRLSGEELPVELIDIELVERKTAQENDPEVNEKQALFAIDQLFEKRKLADSRETWPKRIHIQGPPGVGKSTLSKRIMYEYDWNPRLRGMFDLVILLPLRRLRHSNNMEQLLFDEYFQLEPRGRQIAAALRDLILKSKSLPDDDAKTSLAQGNNILFILDGLDETQGWPEESRDVLSMLIKRPNVVITSRSTTNDFVNSVAPVDLEIEARGLSIKSVWDYLRDDRFVSAEHAENIRHFIESNEVVLGMIQIPIHLDMLCYGWNDLAILESNVANDRDKTQAGEDLGINEESNKSPTITKLYEAIVQRLWRNDIVGLNKRDNGELLTHDIVDAVRDPARLLRVVQHEHDLLGELAFTLICENQLVFTDQDIECAIRELESRRGPLPLSLERNLQALSFIRLEAGEKGRRKYRFVHLTVQEFFAAQHLSKNSAKWEKYLSQFKYSRQWAVIWQFLAGLVSSGSNSGREIEVLFELWEAEPRDLAGYRHANLIMNCLAECEWRLGRVDHPLLQKLVAGLTAWMGWECNRYTSGGLSRQPRFPENILLHEIRKSYSDNIASRATKLLIDRMLTHRRVMSERLCNFLLDHLDPQFTVASPPSIDEWELRLMIRTVLQKISLFPRSVVERLLKYLHDGSFNKGAKQFVFVILRDYQMPEWAHLRWIEIIASRPTCQSTKKLIGSWSSAGCRLLMRIFTQSPARGTSLKWVVFLMKSQPRLPPDVISDLCDRLPSGCEAGQPLGWCNSDILEILGSQTELGSGTIEKMRHQLVTISEDRRLFLAIKLVRCPALQKDVLPWLSAAFGSICKTTTTTLGGGIELTEIATALLSFKQIRPEIFAKLLSHHEMGIRQFALSKLQNPTDLDDVGRKTFHRMLKEVPYDVCLACSSLGRRIELFVDNPITWLTNLLSSGLADRKAKEIDINPYLSLLLKFDEEEIKEESQVLEESFLEAIKDRKNDSWWLGRLLRQKSRLRPETIDRLFDLMKDGNCDAVEALESRVEVAPRALELLRSTTDPKLASSIARIFVGLLSLTIREQFYDILQHQAQQLSEAALQEICVILRQQSTLPLQIIRANNRICDKHAWNLLSLTEFCQNVNSFDAEDIEQLFRHIFIHESGYIYRPDANDCIWIKGGFLYHESANGISSYPLQDATQFRGMLRKALRLFKVPKWQRIGRS